MSDRSRLSPEEQRVYEIIRRETMSSGGIKQTLLRRHPELKDLDPRRVMQIVRKLIKLNIIERSVVKNENKRSYVLIARGTPNNNSGLEHLKVPKLNNVELLLLDIPCIKCRHIYLCSIGRMHDPLRCPLIAYFILEKSGIANKTTQQ